MQLLKRNNQSASRRASEFAQEDKVCGACGYERKVTDTNPKWQCPCCQSAYSKVSAEAVKKRRNKLKDEIAQNHHESRKKERKSKMRNKSANAVALGALGVLHGLGGSCSRVVIQNPIAFAIGVIIIAGAALYYASHLSGG